jgi:hypothetical protein
MAVVLENPWVGVKNFIPTLVGAVQIGAAIILAEPGGGEKLC